VVLFFLLETIAPTYNLTMLRVLALAIFCLLAANLRAQQPAAAGKIEVPAAPVPQHRFWDRENIVLFSGVAVFRGLDYA